VSRERDSARGERRERALTFDVAGFSATPATNRVVTGGDEMVRGQAAEAAPDKRVKRWRGTEWAGRKGL
jgi:hypothetical protein